ncbi:MAG: hypothetical protein II332_07025, partial [Kiritimatiellae bacterium]|nr:hypothetical protein [Kiritimatiellia bacterium]
SYRLTGQHGVLALLKFKIIIPPDILLCNASYAVGMLHGVLHRFIVLALLHLNSATNLGYCPRLADP